MLSIINNTLYGTGIGKIILLTDLLDTKYML